MMAHQFVWHIENETVASRNNDLRCWVCICGRVITSDKDLRDLYPEGLPLARRTH